MLFPIEGADQDNEVYGSTAAHAPLPVLLALSSGIGIMLLSGKQREGVTSGIYEILGPAWLAGKACLRG